MVFRKGCRLTTDYCGFVIVLCEPFSLAQQTIVLVGSGSSVPAPPRPPQILELLAARLPGVAALKPAWPAGVECSLSDDSRPDLFLMQSVQGFRDLAHCCMVTRTNVDAAVMWTPVRQVSANLGYGIVSSNGQTSPFDPIAPSGSLRNNYHRPLPEFKSRWPRIEALPSA